MIDHVTSNMRTMAPFLLWLEHVLGFERYWEVAFHTEDVKSGGEHGSGLKSIVMWDPESGVQASRTTNRCVRSSTNRRSRSSSKTTPAPAFSTRALHALRIWSPRSKRCASAASSSFRHPARTTTRCPSDLKRLEDHEPQRVDRELRKHEILVDGRDDKFMLQIFMKEAANLYGRPKAGPFFFELIQRGGYPGFGEGNFRALFESIEREQKTVR